ncbi:MAG: hypothetical protein WCB78_13210, partial [Pseudolabrys sp.]
MRVAVPRETDAGEPRVAATPETVKKLKSFGAEVAIARGAGIANAAWAADETMFEDLVTRALAGGPSLIAVRIDEQPGVGATERDPVVICERFMRGLG